MNKKNLLVTLAALAITADASALTRSFDGTGQAVLLPYFNAAGGETTLFGVTNHSDQAKAVRVVIAEGRNGRAALAFNVYLGPRDSWNAALASIGENQPPVLITNEDNCTVPSLSAQGETLRTAAFTGTRNDGLGTDAARLQHGSIELIELGVPSGTAAQLIEDGQCDALTLRFVDDGPWNRVPNTDIDAPTGGLTGEIQIIDVGGGVAYRGEPVVLDDFSFGPRHSRPEDYGLARFLKPTASPAAGGFSVGRAQFPIDRGADAVSMLLMSTAFEAGYMLGESLDASTRVVVTLPTRGAYLDNFLGGELAVGSAAVAPFVGASAAAPYCVDSEWQAIDRDGDAGPLETLPLCEQVNVIDLAQDAADGGDVVTGSDTGRVRIDLQPQPHSLPYTVPGANGMETRYAHGLPALVQSLTEVRNSNAQPGVLASYAISHRVLRVTDYDTEF